MAVVDWTSLPSELVESISKKLTIYTDYIRFRAICHTWRSSIPKTPHHLPPQIPWLLLPLHPSNQSYRSTFFNLLNNRVHYLMNPSIKSSSKNRRCGSSHGWLVVLGECPNIFLENPLTGANLELPPLCSFPNVVSFNYANIGREYVIQGSDGQHYTDSLSHMRDCFIKKVVLSSSPLQNHDFTALALLNCADKLAYCKSGSKSWTFIEVASFYFEDAIYKNGSFYTMDKSGRVLVCDVHGPSPKVSIIETTRLFGGDVQYLVSAGDDLLFITRYLVFEFTDELNLARYRTVQFDVFKLDLSAAEWVKITSVGDYVLFIGENSSFSLLASDFPGCTGNCIYYTDDYSEYNCDVFGEPDLGIYNLSDGSIEPLPCYAPNPPYIGKHRPIWLSPSPT